MSISPRVAAMDKYVATEIPNLSRGTVIKPLSQNSGVIYEAYLFTCVVEALDRLQQSCPSAKVCRKLVCPVSAPNTLVLRKKACAIKPATTRYSYARVWIHGIEYELHTDVRVQGRSGVLSELDIVLLDARTCDLLRSGSIPQEDPRHDDVLLFIEAKCYASRLELGIGRGFLGLCKAELEGKPIAYLASPADNNSISDMMVFHGRQKQKFWAGLDDLARNRDDFIQDVASLLCKNTTAKSKRRQKRPIDEPITDNLLWLEHPGEQSLR